MEKANIAMAAAVNLVSCQLNCPEPKTTLTICALKTIIKADAAIDQKIICLTAIAVCSRNSFFIVHEEFGQSRESRHTNSSFLSPPAAPIAD